MEKTSLAISRSAEETAKQFQDYLRKHENDDKLVIQKAVDKPGSKIGDNYTSVLIRTKLIGTRGDGSPYVKTFMTKTLSFARAIAELVDLHALFCMEAHVYRNILPAFGSFGPQCIYADKENIIMEDLAEKGYSNCERRNFLDLDHSIYVLKKLARFHATGLTVKIKNPQRFDEMDEPLKEVIYADDSDASVMRLCTESNLKSIVKYLEMIEPQTKELQAAIDHLSTYIDKTYDRMSRLFKAPKHKYYTICHGDPWANNMLFLHDNDGRIIDLKMVDYQITRHISVTTDILYFIYSSVQSSLIEKSYESLIKIYHNELLKELRRLHIDEKILEELGTEWLEADLKTFSFYGALTGCFLAGPMLAEEEEALRFENEFDRQNPMFNDDKVSINQKKLDRIKCIVSQYHKRYVLGIINDDLEHISITG